MAEEPRPRPDPQIWFLDGLDLRLPRDGEEGWEVLATVFDEMTGLTMLAGGLIGRSSQVLEACQNRGETLPVGPDRLARLMGEAREYRDLLLVAAVRAAEILEDYPELDEVLPDLEQLIQPVDEAEMESLARAAEREGP